MIHLSGQPGQSLHRGAKPHSAGNGSDSPNRTEQCWQEPFVSGTILTLEEQGPSKSKVMELSLCCNTSADEMVPVKRDAFASWYFRRKIRGCFPLDHFALRELSCQSQWNLTIQGKPANAEKKNTHNPPCAKSLLSP